MHPVTHVIFDVDGLLLDTEPIFTMANQKALEPFGIGFTWNMKRRMMGRGHHEAIDILLTICDLHSKTTIEEHDAVICEHLKALFPDCKVLPGAQKLVEHLKKHNIPMALCTGSDKLNYAWKVEKHGDLMANFGHKVLTPNDEDVKHGKPHPDCYKVCASRFLSPPTNSQSVLVFEDAPNGVLAAIGAEMQCVMVPDERVAEEDRAKATLVLRTLEDFKPEMFGLPKYD